MAGGKEEVAALAAGVGFTILDPELGDYVTLLDRARAAFEAVEGMDGRFSPQWSGRMTWRTEPN